MVPDLVTLLLISGPLRRQYALLFRALALLVGFSTAYRFYHIMEVAFILEVSWNREYAKLFHAGFWVV